MIISHSFPLRISNISDKSCRESQNTSLCSLTFSENRAVYEIIVISMVQPDRPKMTIKYDALRVAYWVTKATDAHSEYVILIAFPRQRCLLEDASSLRYRSLPLSSRRVREIWKAT